jgi:drug/metabolite transporter (DMT)-like permease
MAFYAVTGQCVDGPKAWIGPGGVLCWKPLGKGELLHSHIHLSMLACIEGGKRLCRIVSEEFSLIAALVVSELMTVLLYLWSLKFLFVSYAVAAKRSGILLTVVSGWLFFGEHIRDKIAHILLMIAGMMLIVLAPDMHYNLHLRHP